MYTLEMSAKYILGMESPDNFDRYAAKARMLGADHVTAIMQNSLTGTITAWKKTE